VSLCVAQLPMEVQVHTIAIAQSFTKALLVEMYEQKYTTRSLSLSLSLSPPLLRRKNVLLRNTGKLIPQGSVFPSKEYFYCEKAEMCVCICLRNCTRARARATRVPLSTIRYIPVFPVIYTYRSISFREGKKTRVHLFHKKHFFSFPRVMCILPLGDYSSFETTKEKLVSLFRIKPLRRRSSNHLVAPPQLSLSLRTGL